MKKTYLLIAFLLGLALLFIIIALITSSGKKEATRLPSPTPFINKVIAPIITGTAVPNSIPIEIPTDYPKNTSAISALIEKLPHEENSFSLFYNFPDDSFSLLLNKTSTVEGEIKFENFLKQNNILDKNWLQNFTIGYQ